MSLRTISSTMMMNTVVSFTSVVVVVLAASALATPTELSTSNHSSLPQAGFTLKMKHTILSAPNLSLFQKHQNLLRVSKRRLTNTSTSSMLGAPIHRSISDYFYVEMKIGTPPVKVNLALDTGSTTPWAQCAQCQLCFPVSVPVFDPMRSTTYQRMPNNHPLCVPPYAAPSGRYCLYGIMYAEGEKTTGRLGIDRVTFESKDGRQHLVVDVAFGCGIYNERFVAWENDTRGNPISGVVGLGKYDLSSILYQLSPITLLKFSYCLPLHVFGDHDRHHDHALLAFGNDADIRGTSGVQTVSVSHGVSLGM
ncbi:hypothetical protein ACLB2K_064394 [Fragaria x ananassa]